MTMLPIEHLEPTPASVDETRTIIAAGAWLVRYIYTVRFGWLLRAKFTDWDEAASFVHYLLSTGSKNVTVSIKESS